MKKTKFLILASLLFDMEAFRINDDPDLYFEFNGWLDKFGESSIKFSDDFITIQKDSEELASLIEKDFNSGEWTLPLNKDEGLYHYLMPSYYCGFITQKFEKQIADKTKVGTQLQLEII